MWSKVHSTYHPLASCQTSEPTVTEASVLVATTALLHTSLSEEYDVFQMPKFFPEYKDESQYSSCASFFELHVLYIFLFF